MKRYKVTYLMDTPRFKTFASHICLTAENEDKANTKALTLLENLAKQNELKAKITVVHTRELQDSTEWMLDRWYEEDPAGYLDEWELDITPTKLLNKLKKKDPKLYQILTR